MASIPKEDRYCADCGKKGVVERRRCEPCAKEYNRARAKDRYAKYGRYNYGKGICPICGEEMTLWRKDQASHTSCRPKVVENYNSIKRSRTGQIKARQNIIDMGIIIPPDYVVHHINEDPEDNSLNNLVLLHIKVHNGLHRKLQYHRSLWLKDHSKHPENCWNTLRDHLTKAWLETASAKVIRISDIGQSAAEPLSSLEYGEGSETMHGDPKSLDKDKI